ncbi:MAG: hydrogenase nickel incorporation protein HypA [Opitutus sp.]|nr:hydrogenase nickel incorporation protein HypA [Opitutus sp.]
MLVLGVFLALWLYTDRRDRALYAGRRKITFHCIRCDHLYTQPPGTDTAPCPKCNHVNTRLKF